MNTNQREEPVPNKSKKEMLSGPETPNPEPFPHKTPNKARQLPPITANVDSVKNQKMSKITPTQNTPSQASHKTGPKSIQNQISSTRGKQIPVKQKDNYQTFIESKNGQENYEEPGLINFFLFLHINKIVNLGAKKLYQFDMLYKPPSITTHEYNDKNFKDRVLKEFNENQNRSYLVLILRHCFKAYLWVILLGCLNYGFQVLSPIFVKLFLEWLSEPETEDWHGWVYGTVLIFVSFSKPFFHHKRMLRYHSLVIQSQLVTRRYIIDKISSLPVEAFSKLDLGKITNMMTSNTKALGASLSSHFHFIISPLMIVIYSINLITEIGWMGLAVPVIVLIIVQLQNLMHKRLRDLNKKRFQVADQRGKKISEVISGIKMIKFNAWEQIMIDQIDEMRLRERSILKKYFLIKGLILSFGVFSPLLCGVFIFWYYSTYRGGLTLPQTYALLAIFNNLIHPIRFLEDTQTKMESARVASDRIGLLKILQKKGKQEDDIDLELGDLMVSGAEFCWRNQEFDKKFDKMEAQIKSKKKKGAKKKENKVAERSSSSKESKEGSKKLDLYNPVLSGVDFTSKKGEFTAVIGKVGSGKSSLLMGLMDELVRSKGEIRKRGRIAYVSQEAFLLNDTVRENIVFGRPFDAERYQRVLELCELVEDLDVLPGKDLTQIGERGINLSGGQKQRVSLARAVYSDSDIYLIDDSLSALDAHVGQRILDNVFKGELRGKNMIMVTNMESHLEEVDRVVLIDEGRIVANGTLQEVKETEFYKNYTVEVDEKNKSFDSIDDDEDKAGNKNERELTKDHQNGQRNSSKDHQKVQNQNSERVEKTDKKGEPEVSEGEKSKAETQLQKGRLNKKDLRQKGQISAKIYTWYISNAGCLLATLTVIFYTLFLLLKILADWWIGKWTKKTYSISDNAYPTIYLGIIILVAVTIFTRSTLYGMAVSKASFNIFKDITKNILRRKMAYFDTTPSGILMNRCTKDVNDCDFGVPNTLGRFTEYLFQMIGVLLVLVAVFPGMLVAFAMFMCICIGSYGKMMKSMVEFKRLVKLATSPVISKTSELLAGVVTVRAYGKEDHLKKQFLRASDLLNVCEYHERLTPRWLRVRIEYSLWLIVAVSIVGVIVNKSYRFLFIEDPSVIGLLLVYLMTLSNYSGAFMMNLMRLMKEMSSVERIYEYHVWTDHERPWEDPKPREGWPSTGKISLKNVKVRYRDGLPLVLKGVDFEVQPKSKIGIVGRTGSGKSTILLTLLRMIEIPDENHLKEGSKIEIDGLDLAGIGLHYVRRSMVIIPQDPFLLQGTLRYNVDPVGLYSDEEILEALGKVELFESLSHQIDTKTQKFKKEKKLKNDGTGAKNGSQMVPDDPSNSERNPIASDNRSKQIAKILDLQIEKGGVNLSMGQRQLICIARALASKPLILLMDEATANIDQKTDKIIQTVIQQKMKETTVITIAHRLNTIINYDKIVVLGDGVKLEEGAPLELIDQKGEFYEMLSQGGEEYLDKMVELARNGGGY